VAETNACRSHGVIAAGRLVAEGTLPAEPGKDPYRHQYRDLLMRWCDSRRRSNDARPRHLLVARHELRALMGRMARDDERADGRTANARSSRGHGLVLVAAFLPEFAGFWAVR